MKIRDLERARTRLRDALNRADGPYTSIYMARKQAIALLDAADIILAEKGQDKP